MNDNKNADHKIPGRLRGLLCPTERLKVCFAASAVMNARSGRNLKMPDGLLRSDRLGIKKIWRTITLPKWTSSRRYQNYVLPYEWLLPDRSIETVTHNVLSNPGKTDNRTIVKKSTAIKQFFNTQVHTSVYANTLFEQTIQQSESRNVHRHFSKTLTWRNQPDSSVTEKPVLFTGKPGDHDNGYDHPVNNPKESTLLPRRGFLVTGSHVKSVFPVTSGVISEGKKNHIEQLIGVSVMTAERISELSRMHLDTDNFQAQKPSTSMPYDSIRIQQNIAALVANDKQHHSDNQAQLQALEQQLQHANRQQSQSVRQLEQAVNSMATMLQQAMQSQPPRPLPPSYYGALK
ncbi:hypothetical protein [Gynuella sunshinyii]|uniref:Uncharacterized protein n=1 Tax=Gynuella sunshinyii YC6258 TaxID=1445510 RepID=A0A0C5VSI2_9GAMM|nr:hypothetical protein [Gynuella sunshinyii]AJQ93234.1 hypothetical Protein YC6258_01186 [Gynuella sunshinyii YC6258]